MVYVPAQQQEVEAVVEPYHGHDDRAYDAVSAEAVADGDVDREDHRKHRPAHGAEDSARPLCLVPQPARRHAPVGEREHQRQDGYHDHVAQIAHCAEQLVQRAAVREGVIEQLQYLAAVDHDEKAQKQHEHEHHHVEAGAEAEHKEVLVPLGVVHAVHAPHERLHARRSRPDGQEYGDGQRHAAAGVDAGYYTAYNLVERVGDVVADGLEDHLLGQRRVLDNAHKQHYHGYERHEKVVGARRRVGRDAPASHSLGEIVHSVVYVPERTLQASHLQYPEDYFLTYTAKNQATCAHI